jgi:succinate dehydrogenase / fumarate reductase cytochrome b subunit
MKAIESFIKDLFLNFRLSSFAFYGMRITGLALAFFLIVHIYSVSQVLNGGLDKTFKAYDSPLWYWGEFFIFLAFLFHAANGIRVMLGDFFSLTRAQKGILYGTMLVAFALAVAAFPKFILTGWYW